MVSDGDNSFSRVCRIDRLNCDFSSPAPRQRRTRPLLSAELATDANSSDLSAATEHTEVLIVRVLLARDNLMLVNGSFYGSCCFYTSR